MIDIASLAQGFLMVLRWESFVLLIIGLAWGIITGAIPGLTTPLAISMMLPVTFKMPALESIVFLTAIYIGGNMGASISSILLGIPGAPQAIATTIDGYAMAKQGKANQALGVAVAASAYGSILGTCALFVILQLLVAVALKFGPPELCMVAVLGLTIIASLHESFSRGVIAGLLGLLLGSIGMTPSGVARGTMGMTYLLDGIPIVPALIGLVGFTELYYMVKVEYITESGCTPRRNMKELMEGFRATWRYKFAIIRSSLIGIIIGALPGAGATIASIVSYNEGKRASRTPDQFGKGSIEGVTCAEAANNASQGGALATMLALGIPGGTATAVLIGALMLQGLIPGPRFFMDHMPLAYGIIIANLFGSILLIFVGLVICYFAATVIMIPTRILIPVIVVISVVGTYAIRTSLFDVKLMFFLSLIGWVLRIYDYPAIAVVLGVILGPIVGNELLRTHQMFDGDMTVFFTRPISLTLLLLALLSVLLPIIRNRKRQAARP